MTRKKSPRATRRSPKQPRPARGQSLKVVLACLFLCGFLLTALVLLGELRESYRPAHTAMQPAPVTTELLQDVQVELESVLLRSGISLERIQTSQAGDEVRMVVAGDFPTDPLLEELHQRLERLSPKLHLQADPVTRVLSVDFAGSTRFSLRYEAPATPVRAGSRPRVAIIIDDLGRDLEVAKELLDIDLPLTFAVLPYSRHSAQVATLAHRRGREIMIHIPMEPQGYPATDPGQNALFTNLGEQEIRRRFLSYLDQIPYAAGGNNHMGSRFTTDVAGMRTVLRLMKEEGLFFVDSRTTGSSIAAHEATQLGVPNLSRDVFLDNVADVELITQQIRKLVVHAGKHGTAVGICHPYPETVRALRLAAKGLLSQGVVLVSVSELLRG